MHIFRMKKKTTDVNLKKLKTNDLNVECSYVEVNSKKYLNSVVWLCGTTIAYVKLN